MDSLQEINFSITAAQKYAAKGDLDGAMVAAQIGILQALTENAIQTRRLADALNGLRSAGVPVEIVSGGVK